MSKQNREQSRAERAAAVRAEQQRKERNRRMGVIAAVAVVLSGIVALGLWAGGGGSTPDDPADSASVRAGDQSILVGTNLDAAVKVVIWEDFLCPYCRELEISTRGFLRDQAEQGAVLVEYRPIHLLSTFQYSTRSLNAWAGVLNGASAEQALAFHDLLFDNQPYEQTSDRVTDEQIADWAVEAGVDRDLVTEAMKQIDQGFFDASTAAMERSDITGTPTVFINGTLVTTATIPDLADVIRQAVERGKQ